MVEKTLVLHAYIGICLQLYYNVGGSSSNDIIYQNSPVTPEPTSEEEFQSSPENSLDPKNSDESYTTEDLGSVRPEPGV